MLILVYYEYSLAIHDINNFTDCNKYPYFPFKRMIVEITVLGLRLCISQLNIILQETIFNKFKMHSEDEKTYTADGNSHEIAASSQGHEFEDKQ